MIRNIKSGILSGNALKIIALISMTIDHIGLQLFPFNDIFRIIGRIAFPIFAYLIAEGCRYTKNRIKYILTVGVVAFICQIVYFFMIGSLYQCIFVTFFISILVIYSLDNVLKNKTFGSVAFFTFLLCTVIYITDFLPKFLAGTDFYIDYGFVGIILPVMVYFAKSRGEKLLSATICLVVLVYVSGMIQWYSLLAIPLLLLYNGQRGRMKLKWFFYIYYPLHLAVIYFLSTIV